MPAPLAAIALFLGMVLVLCVPPLTLMAMLLRRLAPATERQRPVVQAALVSAVCALILNLAVCLFARPVTGTSAALWGSITAVHIAALLLSWLAFWGCVALAVLPRQRRNAKRSNPAKTGGGELA